MADTKRPKTYVSLILDKSGSMADRKEATIKGFNEQVQQLKENAKDQDILVSLVTFNGNVFEHLWNVPAQELGEATAEDYNPNGGTAMLDAVGYTVQKLLDTTDYKDENVSYLVQAFTDGETNADAIYNWSSFRELTQGCEATKRWTLTYLGCNMAYMQQIATKIGTAAGNFAAADYGSAEGVYNFMYQNRRSTDNYLRARADGVRGASARMYSAQVGVVGNVEKEVFTAGGIMVPNSEPLPQADLAALMAAQPKYMCSSNSYRGGGLFANSPQVKWGDISAT